MTIAIDSVVAADAARREEILSRDLGFGKYFTDRMFTLWWDEGKGWHSPRIGPFQNFQLSPAAAVLHYGQSIFEGQKAYYRADGEVGLFRPRKNAARIGESARRMAMPAVPEDLYLEALDQLIDLERGWVPRRDREALYVRPFSFATEPLQGVRPSSQYVFCVILSPVGAYYKTGFKPVRILVSEQLVRAAKGGTGAAKAAGNYGASLLAGQAASAAGCQQVLWLDAAEHRYVEEIGAMNVMFVIDGELVTAPLGGTILPGVTRDSIITLAREGGQTVVERPVALDELLDAIEAGRCTEAFGCGTAAVITAIETLVYKGREYTLPSVPGPVSESMYRQLTDIQWGRAPDPHGWVHIVPRKGA